MVYEVTNCAEMCHFMPVFSSQVRKICVKEDNPFLITSVQLKSSVIIPQRRKNVDLPNIFGIIKDIFRIESDRAD